MAFKEDLKKYVDKGIEASKTAFEKASGAVSKFGDQSVVRVEKVQLENRQKQNFHHLGEVVYALFAEQGKKELSCEEESIKELLETIENTKKEIEKRDEQLKSEKNEKKDEKNAENS